MEAANMMNSVAEQYDLKLHEEAIIFNALKKNRIFTNLTEEELTIISRLFKKVDFKQREFIFIEGDIPAWLYIVVHGSVKTIKHTPSGRDMILKIKSPGEILGDSIILNDKPYSESAQAKGDVMSIRISRLNLLKILHNYPLLKPRLADYLNDELTHAYDMLASISTDIVEKRIIIILLKHAGTADTGNHGYRKIDFPLTRQEIAEMVGTTVETCIRIMSRFQKQGIVRTSNNSIFVKAEHLKQFLMMN